MAVLRVILVIGALGLAPACVSPIDGAVSTPRWNTLTGAAALVIAHRGASGYRPEHTLEAYALAIEQGADIIEPDLVVTKDGVLVARHDRYLSTTTDVAEHPEFADRRRINPDTNDDPKDDWWVEDFTLAELKTLRARQPFAGRSKEFDGQFEIPAFAEIIALVEEKSADAGRPIGIYPETKHPGYFAKIGLDFEAPLLAALVAFNAGPVFIQSFEPEILTRLAGKTDAMLVQLVYEGTPGAGSNIPLDIIAQYADGVGPAKSILIDQKGCDTGFLGAAHAAGLAVHPWTFRDDQPGDYSAAGGENCAAKGVVEINGEFRSYFILGVDGVFTDFPDTAVAARDAIAQHHQQKQH